MGKIYDTPSIAAPRVEVALPRPEFYDPNPLKSAKNFAGGALERASEHFYNDLLDAHGTLNNLTGGALNKFSGAPTSSSTSAQQAQLHQFLTDSRQRQLDIRNEAYALREELESAVLKPVALLNTLSTTLSAFHLADGASYPAALPLPSLLPLRALDHHITQAVNNFKLPDQPTAFDIGYGLMSAALVVGSMKTGGKLTPKKPLFNADTVSVRDIAGQFTRITHDGKTTLSLHNQKIHVQDGVVRYEGGPLPKHVAEADFFSAVSLRLHKEKISVQSIETTLDFSQKTGRWSEKFFNDFTLMFYATELRMEPDLGKRRLIMASALQQTADQFPELHALDRRKPARLTLIKEGKSGPVFSARFDHGLALDANKDLKNFTAQLNPETAAALDRLIDMVLKSASK